MELDGDIQVNKDGATFKFKEQLMFNIPILKPKVIYPVACTSGQRGVK